jgi:hypothetical protein
MPIIQEIVNRIAKFLWDKNKAKRRAKKVTKNPCCHIGCRDGYHCSTHCTIGLLEAMEP